ncbi:hypothetical protein [Streptomyces inhibens]|uniref:hypothetical protein n=1 Tax=Streptomyces inhibens TaxID=2293571 RepID=UPI001EE6E69D|nr:hypothetical protein [Streptomyces inhibens]UKY50679.1 hypothetical protein KI385_18885 [Streptomyces inhibens]
MIKDHPFADGHHLAWELTGFGADDRIEVSASLPREQFIRVRHLFPLGADAWMLAGEYPVPPDIWEPLREILGITAFREGIDYFLGARQDLPDGRPWRPAPTRCPARYHP